MAESLGLPTIPHLLYWETPALHHEVSAAGALSMRAGPRTDHFVDPAGAVVITNSPRLLCTPDATFMLSAHARGDLVGVYDAAVLMLYVHERSWAKLCLELSPQGEPMIVSVVTNGRSDDCNSVVLSSAAAWLRVATLGDAFAFHYSLDGQEWRFVRHFALHERTNLRAGFSVQAPVGAGCSVTFAEIRYAARSLGALRTGE